MWRWGIAMSRSEREFALGPRLALNTELALPTETDRGVARG